MLCKRTRGPPLTRTLEAAEWDRSRKVEEESLYSGNTDSGATATDAEVFRYISRPSRKATCARTLGQASKEI
jgi:hypothetical protein